MEERKTTQPLEEKTLEVKLNECVIDDVPLLTDEKFDFNLSLTPTSEQEDEVFIGPVGHKEKCIAVSLEAGEDTEDKVPQPEEVLTWSPLAEEKFVEIFKEAHLVAFQLRSGSKPKREDARQLKAEIVETFVQESKSKLKIVERGIPTENTPRAVKRETYCVWESPLFHVPPALQACSKLPGAGNTTPQMPVKASSPFGTEKSTKTAAVSATQAHTAKTNPNMSRLQPVKTHASRNGNHPAVEQAKQARLPSPSCRNSLNSTGSSEDLLSDKSSMAPHVGDASFCGSSVVRVNRTLSTPSKVGIKTQLKLPTNVRMLRDTSSSSSSLSSMNSSFNSNQSISPKRGKVASVGAKTSAGSSRLSSGPSKVSVVRPLMRVSSVQTSHPDVSWKQPTSATKGSSSGNIPKYKSTFSTKSSEPTIHKSSQRSVLEKRKGFTPTTKAALPLSTKEIKNTGLSSENSAANVLQPIGLLSSGNIGSNVAFSPPRKPSETVSNSCPAVKRTSWTPASHKYSALPIPTTRRVSGIPMTPKTLPRLMSSTVAVPPRRVSSVSSKKSLQASSKWIKENKIRFTSSSSSSAEEDSSWPQIVPVALDFSPEKTCLEKELDLTAAQKPAEETPVKEGILIDIEINKMPVVTQECENKPLIDFFNTPESIKAQPLKPTGQLIDLSSPLIRLSPEGNKENLDSPLLKF